MQKKSTNNWVAKHSAKINRPATFVDRKKAAKRGFVKHKRQESSCKLAA